ncbi:MAG: hypothetical protein BAA04_10225 [Firmicutes bacterium ZCTH02-B6]|nr:MAG: hypothetical protein BAA04_10225 [Firmicutes bacterium ZCTH02-B6]
MGRITRDVDGGLGYYALADAKGVLGALDSWLRHRLRACSFGLPEWRVHELAHARKGPGRMASGPLNSVLTNAYWRYQGLIGLVDRYL